MKQESAAGAIEKNPFVGLRPFRTDEDYLFFGREEQTVELVRLLREHRFLAVVGTSGSGKSSLVRAGLMPALQGGTMTQAGSAWEIVIMRPGGSPHRNLAQALVDADFYDPEDSESLPRLEATLNRSRQGLVEAVRQSDVDQGTNVLIVVDQFEELFRFRRRGIDNQEAAGAFVKLLLHASDAKEAKIYIAITMRSDYLGDCAEIPGLAESVNDGEYLIPRLRRQQRRDAIEKPVSVGGATIAPRLVQKLLNEVGDNADQLPVMQHALMRTWDEWAADHGKDDPIDLHHYEAAGRMEAALSYHADAIYDSLPSATHRRTAERLFKTLTERGPDNREIRRPASLEQLIQITGTDREAIETVIDAYRQPGVTFLMPLAEIALEPETVIDISHESLMRVWTRLRAWVEEEAQSARIFQRLSDTAELNEDGKAGLYKDPDLQIAQSWREEQAPTAAWAEQYGGRFTSAISFLELSHDTAEREARVEEESRQRELEQARALAESEARASRVFKRFALVVAMLALAAMVLAVWALDSRSEVQDLLGKTEEAKRQTEIVYEEAKHNQGLLWVERASRQRFEKSLLGSQLSAARAIGFQGYGRASRGEDFARAYPPLLRPGSEAWKRAESLINDDSNLAPIWSSPLMANLTSHVHPSITPDLSVIAAADHSATLLFWDARSGEAMPPLELGQVGNDAFFLSNDRLVVLSTGAIDVWSWREQKRITRIEQPDTAASCLAYKKKWLAAEIEKSIGIWDLETGEKVKTLAIEAEAEAENISIDPHGRYVLYSIEGRLVLRSTESEEANTGIRLPLNEEDEVIDFDFVAGGTHVVATVSPRSAEERASRGRPSDRKVTLYVWDVATTELVQSHALENGSKLVSFGQIRRPFDGHSVWISHATHGEKEVILDIFSGEAIPLQPRLEALGIDTTIAGTAIERGRVFLSTTSRLTVASYPELEREGQATGHVGAVESSVFSADGRHMISTGTDGVRVWDAASGTQLRHLSTDPASACAVTPDGALLATGHGSGETKGVQFWDARTWEPTKHLDRAAYHLAFSPDGDVLAYVGEGDEVHLIDTHSLEAVRPPYRGWPELAPDTNRKPIEFQSHSRVTELIFSPEGATVAITAEPNATVVGKAPAGGDSGPALLLLPLDPEEGAVTLDMTENAEAGSVSPGAVALAFSPDGLWMAWASGSRIHLLNRLSGEREILLGLDNASVYSAIAFDPSGEFIAAGTFETGAVILWNFHSRECVAEINGHGDSVTSLQFAPDARSLLSASRDGTVRLWETAPSRIKTRPGGEANYQLIQFLPNGELLGVAANAFDFISPENGGLLRRVPFRGSIGKLAPYASKLSFDGSLFASLVMGETMTLVCLDTRTGEQVDWGVVGTSIPAFSPRHEGLVVAYPEEERLEFLSSSTKEPVASYDLEDIGFPGVVFSPDGRRIATITREGSQLLVLSGPDFQETTTMDLPEGHDSFRLQAFHPTKPNWLVTSAQNGSLTLFDADTGEIIANHETDNENPYTPVHYARVRWSPDGQFVLNRNSKNGLRLYRVPSLTLEREFDTLSEFGLDNTAGSIENFLKSMSFSFDVSPDGQRLAVNVSGDGIYLWPLADEASLFDASRLASVMDYFTFAESSEDSIAAKRLVGEAEGEVNQSESNVAHPESLSPRVSQNLYQATEHRVAPFSTTSHYGILQKAISSEERDRELFKIYLSAGNWMAAGAVLRGTSGELFENERRTYADAVSSAAASLENKALALVWLSFAQGVVPNSEKLKSTALEMQQPTTE